MNLKYFILAGTVVLSNGLSVYDDPSQGKKIKLPQG